MGNNIYSMTLARSTSTVVSQTIDAGFLAHAVLRNISMRLHWHNESTVDWYAYSAGELEPDGTLRVQVGPYVFLCLRQRSG